MTAGPRDQGWVRTWRLFHFAIRASAHLQAVVVTSLVGLVGFEKLFVANGAVAQIAALIGRGLAAVFITFLKTRTFAQRRLGPGTGSKHERSNTEGDSRPLCLHDETRLLHYRGGLFMPVAAR